MNWIVAWTYLIKKARGVCPPRSFEKESLDVPCEGLALRPEAASDVQNVFDWYELQRRLGTPGGTRSQGFCVRISVRIVETTKRVDFRPCHHAVKPKFLSEKFAGVRGAPLGGVLIRAGGLVKQTG